MNIRKDVWTIENDANDDTIVWLEKAIKEMKALPITDHRSLRWQAAIHAYNPHFDPYKIPNETMPSSSEQATFWDQCQHGTWFFIPWHRMYLHHFESIVREYVISLGGPVDWALPYWNYSKGRQSRLLPPSFRNPTLSDGTPNSLYVAERNPLANAGQEFAGLRDVNLFCLTESVYENPSQISTGFGGGATGFVHSGQASGLAEQTPHANMHVAVNGFMGSFNTAGLDPMFYLHHCNIDRLWEVWRGRDDSHTNPTAPAWLRGVSFDFIDVSGTHVSMHCEDVEDTQNSLLNYQYEDISDPIADTFGIEKSTKMAKIPQLVCASNAPLKLSGTDQHVRTVLNIPSATKAGDVESFGVDDETNSVVLQIENLTSEHNARGYDLYIGVPDGENPVDYEDRFVARMPLFGLPESSVASGPHAGSGLSFTYDVTEIVRELDLVGEIPLSFHSLDDESDSLVTVGRISFYRD